MEQYQNLFAAFHDLNKMLARCFLNLIHLPMVRLKHPIVECLCLSRQQGKSNCNINFLSYSFFVDSAMNHYGN